MAWTYLISAGRGAVGTAIVGILVFKDPATFGRLFFHALIIASVVGLELVPSE